MTDHIRTNTQRQRKIAAVNRPHHQRGNHFILLPAVSLQRSLNPAGKIRQQLFFDGGFRASGLYALKPGLCQTQTIQHLFMRGTRGVVHAFIRPACALCHHVLPVLLCRSNHLFSPLLAGMMPAVS